jgi:hypothetical protein
MPCAIRPSDFRPQLMHFAPRSLRMNLPRTRPVRVDFQAWRARLRSLDLPSIVGPLRAVNRRLMAAGVVAILGGTCAVLAVARVPAPANQPPPVIARADASADAPCARQTWPYLDRRCLADAREAPPPGRLITTDNLAMPPNFDTKSTRDTAPAAVAPQDAAAVVGKNSEPGVAPSQPPVAPSEPRMRQLHAGERPLDQQGVPRQHRWTGLEYNGRGRFYGKRRAIIRPLSREELMTRPF